MFRRSTAFVLGAGASWHYGYPTGEDLVRRVIEQAKALAAFFGASFANRNTRFPAFINRNVEASAPRSLERWHAAYIEANELAVRLKQVNPTLIDYFLAHNPDLHDIGRLAIAMVILQCEYEFKSADGNYNHITQYKRRVDQGLAPPSNNLKVGAFDDDWLRFVLYKITVGCSDSAELLQNRVQFITFNYDTSLEQRLFWGLSNISHFVEADVDKFMWRDRVFHMYGSVRENFDRGSSPVSMMLSSTGQDPFEAAMILDIAFNASKGIRTIDGDDKIKDSETIAKAKGAIRAAQTIYVLGFGFDASNVMRAGLDSLAFNDVAGRNVFFTNFGGHNRVGTAAGRALLNGSGAFVPPNGSAIQERYFNNFSFKYQMSVKNVYDSLSQDFESLEMD